MRSYDPGDPDDASTAVEIRAEPWQIELLGMNPAYVHWGPHEDYMIVKEGGWNSPQHRDGWAGSSPGLNELNEVVNFYFGLRRESEECGTCEGSGATPDAKRISNDWYGFDAPARRWKDKLTQDEVDALIASNRVPEGSTPASLVGYFHDSINQWICTSARCKRVGIEEKCPTCEGRGHNYTSEACSVDLTLWVLHPRKGASRGWEIRDIKQSDLPDVFRYLREAADRNAERFSKIPAQESQP